MASLGDSLLYSKHGTVCSFPWKGSNGLETEARCKARALEMAGDINRYMKSHKPVRYKCRKLPGGAC